MSDDAAPEPKPKNKAPITLMKERAEAAEAQVAELTAALKAATQPRTETVAASPAARGVVPVDLGTFLMNLIVASATKDPAAFSREMLPGHKKVCVLAVRAYYDLCERYSEFDAVLAAEEALERSKLEREEADRKAEKAREEARKAKVRPGPVTIVRDVSPVRSPEQVFLDDVKRTGQLVGPMAAEQD